MFLVIRAPIRLSSCERASQDIRYRGRWGQGPGEDIRMIVTIVYMYVVLMFSCDSDTVKPPIVDTSR